jgi:hypothetical protein
MLALAERRNTLRKEDTTMDYTRPEVSYLGRAETTITGILPKQVAPFTDGPRHLPVNPAYDLDE